MAPKQAIDELPDGIVQAAVRNLKLTLESEYGYVDERELRSVLRELPLAGDAAAGRDAIVQASADVPYAAALCRALLASVREDTQLTAMVDEAIDDALEAQTMDFGISLLVIGVVAVLWRWRPKKVVKKGNEITVEWPDDDDTDGLATVLSTMARAGGLG